MADKRIPQVNELMQQELALIIAREVEFPLGSLATITRVTASPDLKNAFIWVSVIPESATAEVLKMLRKQAGRLQNFLNKRLAMQRVPRIIFKLETGEEEAEEREIHSIEQLLDKIKAEDNLYE